MSAPLGQLVTVSQKRRASVLSHPSSPSKPPKVPKREESTVSDLPPSSSLPLEDLEIDPKEHPEVQFEDAESNKQWSDECGADDVDPGEELEYEAENNGLDSDWPDSDGTESDFQEMPDPHPLDSATAAAIKFRTKAFTDEYAEFECFDEIFGNAIHAANTPDAKEIGNVHAKLIERDRIRRTFYQDMEEASHNTSQLAFDIFDRHGCLKSELISHCVRKGSGVWGDEVDEGPIFLVERVSVDKHWRRKGIGAKLVMNVWRKAKKLNPELRFGFAWATQLNDTDRRLELAGKPKAERRAAFHRNEATASKFWRSLGYRRVGSTVWFGFAADPVHASRKVSATDDFDPSRSYMEDSESEEDEETMLRQWAARSWDGVLQPAATQESPRLTRLKQQRPVHYAVTVLTDSECLLFPKERLLSYPITDSTWEAVDRTGNTILHLAALLSKHQSLDWIMDVGLGTQLISVRNHEGYTPVEALQSLLQSERVRKELLGFSLVIACSDNFRGFDDESVLCLLRLRGIRNLSEEEIARVKFGCTCDECIEGFLSPRMSHALLYQAEVTHDMLNGELRYMSAEDWCEENEYLTTYIRPSVRDNLRTNKSMREGFVNIFDHIASCLRFKQVPNERNVLMEMQNASELPPVTKNFLQRGGRVSDALSVMFDHAMDQDERIGDGEYLRIVNDDDFRRLKKCRNDHEFGFVRFYCGLEPQVSVRTGTEISESGW